MSDRKSIAPEVELITDPDELAAREVENGIGQFRIAMDIVKDHVQNHEKPFQLRASHILRLHEAALIGIHPQAGTFRNSPVSISKSNHQPPEHYFVADFVTEMCDYVNSRWNDAGYSKIHLSAYLMWQLNWIHPFKDGNGRTSRVVSYTVLCLGMNSVLPGTPTIPDQISAGKYPYYNALEKADDFFGKNDGKVDVSAMEELLSAYLAKQLLSATEQAGVKREMES